MNRFLKMELLQNEVTETFLYERRPDGVFEFS